MKKCFVALAALLFSMCMCGTALAQAANLPPAITADLLAEPQVPAGAEKILMSGFEELTTPNQVFSVDTNHVVYEYTELEGDYGCYRIGRKAGSTSGNPYFMGRRHSAVLPNRSYLVSALVYTDFDRSDCEVNIGLASFNGKNNISLIDGFNGLPAKTEGWQRINVVTTTAPDAVNARFYGMLAGFYEDTDGEFYIADVDLYLLPEEPLTPLGVGEGLTFNGISQPKMRVQSAVEANNIITVTTTGAIYEFNKTSNTITAKQRIGLQRTLMEMSVDKPLANLAISSKTNKEAILTTGDGGISFGVQMDSMLFISTHTSDANITVTSAIDTEWNRLVYGNLLVSDDDGGFSVNPAIPLGTGRTARYTVGSGVNFSSELGDVTSTFTAKAPWSVIWTISSGERLGVSVFPMKEYDWESSYSGVYTNITCDQTTDIYATYKKNDNISAAVLWDFTETAWGMSYGTEYKLKNEYVFKNHISAAKAQGVKPLEYMSMYFYNAGIDNYINEVTRHKTQYGIEGVYSDGVPSIDWIEAYDGMRRLRQVFPTGCIILHTTGQSANGGAPLATPEVMIPAIDAYADITLRGEEVKGSGMDWLYPRYITSGYAVSNAIGVQKGDGWSGVTQEEQNYINLLYNGRARRDGSSLIGYNNILGKLRDNWSVTGNSNDYYRECYLPYVRRLVRNYLTDYPTSTLLYETFDNETNGVLRITDSTKKSLEFIPSYGKTDITFSLILNEEKPYGCFNVSSSYEDTAVSILVYNNSVSYLTRRGGYVIAADNLSEGTHNITVSLDPATARMTIKVDGSVVVEDAFSNTVADIAGIDVISKKGAFSLDNISVNTGL